MSRAPWSRLSIFPVRSPEADWLILKTSRSFTAPTSSVPLQLPATMLPGAALHTITVEINRAVAAINLSCFIGFMEFRVVDRYWIPAKAPLYTPLAIQNGNQYLGSSL